MPKGRGDKDARISPAGISSAGRHRPAEVFSAAIGVARLGLSIASRLVGRMGSTIVESEPGRGKPRDEWKLRSVREIWSLRRCDRACGSAVFFVPVRRRLAKRLMVAWEGAAKQTGAEPFDADPQTPAALPPTGTGE
jgi:hypothetical protein